METSKVLELTRKASEDLKELDESELNIVYGYIQGIKSKNDLEKTEDIA